MIHSLELTLQRALGRVLVLLALSVIVVVLPPVTQSLSESLLNTMVSDDMLRAEALWKFYAHDKYVHS